MFLETSAKTSFNIIEAFGLSAQAIFNIVDKDGDNNIDDNVVLNMMNRDNKKEKGCC